MSESTQADRDLVRTHEGCFLGDMDDDVLESFKRCKADGLCAAYYTGVAGLMGLGKIRWIDEP